MATITKNTAPSAQEVVAFLNQIDFTLPEEFIAFFKTSNGADISTEANYLLLWALTDMVQLNKDYRVEEFAPDFFVFGSDGGGTAFAIEKGTSAIYEMPFIGMSKEEAIFRSKSFGEFIKNL